MFNKYQQCCHKKHQYIRKCILSTETSPQLIAVIIVIQNINALHDFDPFLFLFIFARSIVSHLSSVSDALSVRQKIFRAGFVESSTKNLWLLKRYLYFYHVSDRSSNATKFIGNFCGDKKLRKYLQFKCNVNFMFSCLAMERA